MRAVTTLVFYKPLLL